ncbi:MAG TPA: hypothetical protein VGE39_07385, partial [Prosthecobacter sp.]
MKTPTRICNALVCASMLAAGGSAALAQNAPLPPAAGAGGGAGAPPSPSAVTPPALMPAPPPSKVPDPNAKVDAADFHSKITKDNSPLPNGGQLQMSYATVVDKILPSVVTIYSSAPIKTPQVDEIPPQLRPFFYRFFGAPGGGGNPFEEDEEQAPNPRRRGQPRQMPQEEEEEQQQKGVGSGVIITHDGYIM